MCLCHEMSLYNTSEFSKALKGLWNTDVVLLWLQRPEFRCVGSFCFSVSIALGLVAKLCDFYITNIPAINSAAEQLLKGKVKLQTLAMKGRLLLEQRLGKFIFIISGWEKF